MERIEFRLTKEETEQLDKLAKSKGRSRANLVAQTMRELLKQLK